MSVDEIKRHRKVGRPTNEQLSARGLVRKVKSCKICRSPHSDEITKALLEGVSGEDVRRHFNQLPYFQTAPLNSTNIHSHKKHSNFDKLAEIDHRTALQKESLHDPELAAVFQQKYDEKFDRLKAIDELYKQRLINLGALQYELETLRSTTTNDQTAGNAVNKARIQELTLSLDMALNSVGNVILKHMKVDQGPAAKNISIMYINNVRLGIGQFITAFMDVLVEEISDTTTQIRIKEKFIEKLDESVAPLLDEKKLLEADYVVTASKVTQKEIA